LETFLLRWNPDAIVFDSSQLYGTPSYWVQRFFSESSGANVLNTALQTNTSKSLVASAITWKDSNDSKNYLRIKVYFLIIYLNIFIL
jgi:alpha-N-arabinofuranosidase